MKKLCAIISGGRRAPLDGIENADRIIACDKGYQYAEEAGVRPQLLVGDFDSYTGSLPADIPILDLPVEKDDTDTMAAIRYAVQEGYSEIFLYCALGGRLDHLLGNVQSAVFAVERGCRVHIIDTDNLLYFFTDGTLTLPPRAGWSLSLLSLTDRCENVSVTGVKYPLRDATLTNGFPIGVSNEWRGEAQISVGGGVLLVVMSKM